MSRKYDPFRHHRRSTRYKYWDYRTPGFYFITICTRDRQHVFDHHNLQAIVANRLQMLPTKSWACHVLIDTWIVMPNHIHVIIQIVRFWDEKQAAPVPQTDFHHAPVGSIGAIVGQYKSMTTRAVSSIMATKGQKLWQRGYWDRIIRDERELNATRKYIQDNPVRWAEGRDNLNTITSRMIYHP